MAGKVGGAQHPGTSLIMVVSAVVVKVIGVGREEVVGIQEEVSVQTMEVRVVVVVLCHQI
jgi:hypothetical protein